MEEWANRMQWIDPRAISASLRCPSPVLRKAAGRLGPKHDGARLQLPSALERSTTEQYEGHPRERRRGRDNGERYPGRDEVPARGAARRGRTRLRDQVVQQIGPAQRRIQFLVHPRDPRQEGEERVLLERRDV